MGQTQTVFLPPWVPTTEEEKAREAEFRDTILKIGASASNFVSPHPVVDSPDFEFDWVEHRPFAEAAYRADGRLLQLLPRLVPKRCASRPSAPRAAPAHPTPVATPPCPPTPTAARAYTLRVSEEAFWRNYFSHVFAVKQRFAAGSAAPLGGDVGTGGSAEEAAAEEAAAAAVATPSAQELAAQASALRLSAVSYPDKFHLAVKYAQDGPPLPNLSDADRILLEALEQQATVGECNRARPGMWDTAEAKAKYEAWKKLGTMSRAEAMHLYVQAIEVFDEQWLQWPGLEPHLPADVPPVTPVTKPHATRTAGSNGSSAPPLLLALRDLRASIPQLRAADVPAVRGECQAILRALESR